MKLNSIPESEPFYNVIKSRVVNLAKIKDKDERKYWRELKRDNAIPDIYLGIKEINEKIKNEVKGEKNGNKFNKFYE